MGDKIRVLICKTCGSAEELPWYEGPVSQDSWLERAVNRHPGHLAGGLFNIDVQQFWNTKEKRKITLESLYTQLEIPGTGPGLGDDFYNLKSTYLDDAMTCWKGFNRTTDPGHCDYFKENKRILPDTKADRKELGLDPKDRPNTFLCQFCPVHSLVMQKKRKAAGAYN